VFIGNTTVSIYRATQVNTFGDTVDDNTTPVSTGHRCSLIEQNRRSYIPAENQDRVVRFVRGRLLSDVDVREGDRLKDEATNVFYIVETVVNPGSAFSSGDKRVDLKLVN
jgi:hypothetical protein